MRLMALMLLGLFASCGSIRVTEQEAQINKKDFVVSRFFPRGEEKPREI